MDLLSVSECQNDGFFGNASGPLAEINVPKQIQPKGLYLTRPSMQQYLSTREEIEGAQLLFEK